jgi:hypothetical protein
LRAFFLSSISRDTNIFFPLTFYIIDYN